VAGIVICFLCLLVSLDSVLQVDIPGQGAARYLSFSPREASIRWPGPPHGGGGGPICTLAVALVIAKMAKDIMERVR
jgi:hypothetical protein